LSAELVLVLVLVLALALVQLQVQVQAPQLTTRTHISQRQQPSSLVRFFVAPTHHHHPRRPATPGPTSVGIHSFT